MNMDWEAVLKNNELLLKIFGIFLIVSISVVPGGMLLFIEKTELFLNLSFAKLIFTSFILSIPFTFSGTLMYMFAAIFGSATASSKLPTSIKIFQSIISIYIFSLTTVGFVYVAVRRDSGPFFYNQWFAGNLKHLYIANYFLSIMLFTMLIFFSMAAIMKKEEKEASKKSTK